MGLTKLKVEDFFPLVTRCERLTCASIYLNQAGRLQKTNVVFTSMPMFYLCAFLMHKTTIKKADKYRKHSIWRGLDVNARNLVC